MNLSQTSIERGLFHVIVVLAAIIFFSLLHSSLRKNRTVRDPDPLPLVVDIRGETNQPGVHLLDGPCATLADVLRAAGIPEKGMRIKDNEESYGNQVVCSGQAIHIASSQGDEVSVRLEPMPASARLTLGMKLDLNEASEEEFCLVPLMKQGFASAIVERRKHRPWEHLQELQEIQGVGPKTTERWKDYLEIPSHN